MKTKPLALLVVLMLVMPTALYAYEEPAKGTMDNPFYSSRNKTEEGTVKFKGINFDTFEEVTANITVSVVGELKVGPTYDKITELTGVEARGPFYFCYKVLLKAENIKGGNAITVSSDDFKVYNTQKEEVKILTEFEEVELLSGTGAYMYIGVRTSKKGELNTYPLYIVFNNELWFDVLIPKLIDD